MIIIWLVCRKVGEGGNEPQLVGQEVGSSA